MTVSDIVSLIKDQTAKDIVDGAFGIIGTVGISTSASYSDSPAALNTLLSRADVKTFRTLNAASQIDMYLFPSKSIDENDGVDNAADWVVNFYTSSSSLVLWISSGNGVVQLSN